ncbi:endonuclease domain-containing protein [Taklimakanibacter lacteus]|uniref:endonuclease domain-containing protein n=1 Tax=Taklimakanibacter lacteus TaxID=2268456 RepID=UPI0034D3D1A0
MAAEGGRVGSLNLDTLRHPVSCFMKNPVAFARSLRKQMTPEEVKLWVRLRTWRSEGYHFRRQAPVDGYVLDFLCKTHKLIVEVDGSQHGESQGLAYDEKRDTHFRRKGYRIVRLWNADINRDPDASADTIWAVLQGEDPFS